MITLTVLLLALLGLNMNMAFSSSLIQPDWALALLLASLLAKRHNWFWVLPAILLHDVTFYWSLATVFMVVAMIPLAMIYLDQHLGAGLPQRLVLLVLALLAMMADGWTLQACLLTLCLCIPVWHLLTRQYAQQAA
ncbi:hypothetical protein [Mariprofundus ferrooxydans]|uniref:Rod shape-determining protein MreD n=1 Tax=Mariprofundus ferrooxydans PV-1 TaxID=314345 RepID=Q0EWL0_9PROT|nr:hypothetical protein [Mariprofundus ferrooxydans]EAU53667.1 hypothetical protein SPV1_12460 [Mariprofundus ferrooxydans PV-1]KON47294.1 hypothetical protein AL013_08545 [Mariprofundus ferrooxydans]